jgi:hypothetical protein
MKPAYAILGFAFVAASAGFGGYHLSKRSGNAEIARIAAVNVERSIRVRRDLEQKAPGSARDLLDAGIGQDLFYMQAFESAALSDDAYAKQRARSIALVKQEWLRRPPFALDDGTRLYIDEVCLQIKTCPQGELQARKNQG